MKLITSINRFIKLSGFLKRLSQSTAKFMQLTAEQLKRGMFNFCDISSPSSADTSARSSKSDLLARITPIKKFSNIIKIYFK